jgi:hypothetical protein
LIVLKGWAATETGACVSRARDLCRQVDSSAELSPIQYGLWINLLFRGRLREVLELADELLATAKATGDDSILLMACETSRATNPRDRSSSDRR